MTCSVTIRTHYQLTHEQRIKRGNGYLNDRPESRRKHASYIVVDKRGRTAKVSSNNPITVQFSSFGPGWLMPRVLETVTAAIVWGICGKMADTPEY